ncbi:MAG: hypothetical protein ACHQVK_02325, partial [Candidatus Paceibacterales bacterium]
KDIQLGLQCGADDYIIKPIDPIILQNKVEGLLSRKMGTRESVALPEGPVRQKAQWTFEVEITYISESGVVISSPVAADEQTRFMLQSPFYKQIDIDPPLLRVVNCAKDSTLPHFYNIKANFIGLTDTELQKIRAWLNLKFSPTRKAS